MNSVTIANNGIRSSGSIYFPFAFSAAFMQPPSSAVDDFRAAVAAYERSLLEDALARNRFNQRATASALGLSYDQLRHALKRHKLQDSAPA